MKPALISRHVQCFLMVAALVSIMISCRPHAKVETPATNQLSATDDIAQADQLYAQREDLARVQQGIVLLRQAIAAEPGNYDAQWRLAKFDYYLGTHFEADRENAFREGVEAGKTAVKLHNDKPEGHFWLGANYGGGLEADMFGLASVDDVRNEMAAAQKITEGYQDGSAYMILVLLDPLPPTLLGAAPPPSGTELAHRMRSGSGKASPRLPRT